MTLSLWDKLLGKTEPDLPEERPHPTVVITDVLPHGADLLYVRGTVDGVEAKTYVPSEAIHSVREARRRSYLASYLRGSIDRAAADREAMLRLTLLGTAERTT